MKIVFMGTPEFAVASLRAVVAHHEVVLVIAQPDRPAGRGSQLTAPPVKLAAEELGLPCFQPASARKPDFLERLASVGADVGVVVAYGKILPPAVLAAFPHGCLNVHGSILPAYRGAAPVQWAVINGDAETGVSIMQLDEGMDTGPVESVVTTPIGEGETSGQLMTRLADLGAAALVPALARVAAGQATFTAQDAGKESHARMLEKRDGAIDFAQPERFVAARVRGVDPWPGAVAELRGQPCKLFGARAVLEGGKAAEAPGTVLAIDGNGALVACGDGAVRIAELQLPGRKRMTAAQVAQGRSIVVGDVLQRPAGLS